MSVFDAVRHILAQCGPGGILFDGRLDERIPQLVRRHGVYCGVFQLPGTGAIAAGSTDSASLLAATGSGRYATLICQADTECEAAARTVDGLLAHVSDYVAFVGKAGATCLVVCPTGFSALSREVFVWNGESHVISIFLRVKEHASLWDADAASELSEVLSSTGDKESSELPGRAATGNNWSTVNRTERNRLRLGAGLLQATARMLDGVLHNLRSIDVIVDAGFPKLAEGAHALWQALGCDVRVMEDAHYPDSGAQHTILLSGGGAEIETALARIALASPGNVDSCVIAILPKDVLSTEADVRRLARPNTSGLFPDQICYLREARDGARFDIVTSDVEGSLLGNDWQDEAGDTGWWLVRYGTVKGLERALSCGPLKFERYFTAIQRRAYDSIHAYRAMVRHLIRSLPVPCNVEVLLVAMEAACIYAYKLLSSKQAERAEVDEAISSIDGILHSQIAIPYLGAVNSDAGNSLYMLSVRWRLSLQYVKASLLLRIDQLEQAERAFASCRVPDRELLPAHSRIRQLNGSFMASVIAYSLNEYERAERHAANAWTDFERFVKRIPGAGFLDRAEFSEIAQTILFGEQIQLLQRTIAVGKAGQRLDSAEYPDLFKVASVQCVAADRFREQMLFADAGQLFGSVPHEVASQFRPAMPFTHEAIQQTIEQFVKWIDRDRIERTLFKARSEVDFVNMAKSGRIELLNANDFCDFLGNEGSFILHPNDGWAPSIGLVFQDWLNLGGAEITTEVELAHAEAQPVCVTLLLVPENGAPSAPVSTVLEALERKTLTLSCPATGQLQRVQITVAMAEQGARSHFAWLTVNSLKAKLPPDSSSAS
ncbi:hypothetical protein [Oryzibacter oryziterrae]|uniref:hypothetical protein n=1 Tax=Oryzibacter oryziterrae TaxID=2766474 RepID=UPI001F426C99|nr:hypothetical protein [Oryzibacter oryziterrae]